MDSQAQGMGTRRLVGRLDIKERRLIKGIHLEGWRVIGDPHEYARRYYEAGIDELIYIDAVASLYSRSKLVEIVESTTKDLFVPLTVGGGVRTCADAYDLLRAGADKIAVCTEAIARPSVINEIADTFGSQCMVVSIQAKRRAAGGWEAYADSGREPMDRDVVAWAREAEARGAGEILLTSIDQEGTGKGFDLDLTKAVSDAVGLRAVASGGFGTARDFVRAVRDAGADGAAVAAALHYDRVTVSEIRREADDAGISMRSIG